MFEPIRMVSFLFCHFRRQSACSVLLRSRDRLPAPTLHSQAIRPSPLIFNLRKMWIGVVAHPRTTDRNESRIAQLPRHVLLIPHPQVGAPTKQASREFAQTGTLRLHSQVGLTHKLASRYRVSRSDIPPRQRLQIRQHKPERPTRLQIRVNIAKRRPKLIERQVLQHMRAINRIHASLPQRQSADHVTIFNVLWIIRKPAPNQHASQKGQPQHQPERRSRVKIAKRSRSAQPAPKLNIESRQRR